MSKHTILWADDDPDELNMIQEVLRESEHPTEIIEVYNGLGVLKYLDQMERALPCLVILDINMPLLNGKDTVKEIRKDTRFQKLPLIIYTTSSNEKDKAFCTEYHLEMITKPPTYSELKKIVHQILHLCAHGDHPQG